MHPADELAKVRERIRALRVREMELRPLLEPGNLEGEHWRAEPFTRTYEKLTGKPDLLRLLLGTAADRFFIKTQHVRMIRLHKK